MSIISNNNQSLIINKKTLQKHFAYVLLFFVMIIYLVYVLGVEHLEVGSVLLKTCCVCLLITYAIVIYLWVNITSRIVSPFFMLLLSCFAFNAGQVFLYVFDIDINNWYVVINNNSNNLMFKAFFFQLICVLSLVCGALTTAKRNDEIRGNKEIEVFHSYTNKFDYIDILFFVVSGIVLISSVMAILSRSSYAYGELESNNEGYMYIVYYSFHILIYFEFLRKSGFKWNAIILGIGFARAVSTFLMGARYSIVPLFLGLAVIQLTVKNKKVKLKKWQIVLIVFASFVFLSLMRGWTYLRQYSLSQISWDLIKSTYSEGIMSGFYDTLAETGNSVQPLIRTISIVDAGNGTGDRTILYAFALGIFPKKVLDVLGFSPQISSLSAWITSVIGVKNGQGYSIFAEAYFNYKEFGFIFMFLFGMAFSKLENLMIKLFYTNELFMKLLACSLLYLLAYESFLARADFLLMASYFRFCFYILLIIIIKNRGKVYLFK